MVNVALLQPGEAANSERIIAECGTAVISGVHYPVAQHLETAWSRFLMPELIEATCLTGTPERVVERLKELERQGLNQIMLYPPLNRQYRVIEDFRIG
jgi:alkanesulfonate monooxygenase SsuD/methylene tetrahydromethanopterin reductase-like flavin-dependent oxidoreductase (luciferase family)